MSSIGNPYSYKICSVTDMIGQMRAVVDRSYAEVAHAFGGGTAVPDSFRADFAMASTYTQAIQEAWNGARAISQCHSILAGQHGGVFGAGHYTYTNVLRMAIDASELNLAVAVLRNKVFRTGNTAESVRMAAAIGRTLADSYTAHVDGSTDCNITFVEAVELFCRISDINFDKATGYFDEIDSLADGRPEVDREQQALHARAREVHQNACLRQLHLLDSFDEMHGALGEDRLSHAAEAGVRVIEAAVSAARSASAIADIRAAILGTEQAREDARSVRVQAEMIGGEAAACIRAATEFRADMAPVPAADDTTDTRPAPAGRRGGA